MRRWTKRPHPVWGSGGKEEKVHSLGLSVSLPKWQWLSDDGFSIVGPATLFSFGKGELYEVYDRNKGEIIGRFKTLKEAKSLTPQP